ncbi:MAG: peptidase T [Erysipelotrichaceae bacterium]|nr:peptidase T [Erysipelotrichaceae bacterium]
MIIDNREFYDSVIERMMRYARIDTQSQPFSGTWPTTAKQHDLAKVLAEEMQQLNVSDVYYDREHCVVYGTLPSNLTEERPAVGFLAHLDTAPDAPGANCHPWLLKNYDGKDIVLNEEKSIVMKTADYHNLNNYIDQDLILTDGTTLLGGDDKAAIAAIMTMLEYYKNHPETEHCEVRVAFTPDEEVAGNARDLDLKRFGAKIAYTIDCDHLGYYQDETFNAAQAVIDIKGLSVHTATAKGIMINAVDIAGEFMSMLPKEQKPQYTSGIEGFYHVISCEGTCEKARIVLNIRDFDENDFNAKKEHIMKCVSKLNDEYGTDTVRYTIIDQYGNMKAVIDQVPFMIDYLRQAITDSGITPVCEPFRGGTDGAGLSFRGLPCPNISAGYENAHGRFEYVSVQSMMKNVEILIRLISIYSKANNE